MGGTQIGNYICHTRSDVISTRIPTSFFIENNVFYHITVLCRHCMYSFMWNSKALFSGFLVLEPNPTTFKFTATTPALK
jgi:predicted nucleic-acid-binding Zn-ribbon protein